MNILLQPHFVKQIVDAGYSAKIIYTITCLLYLRSNKHANICLVTSDLCRIKQVAVVGIEFLPPELYALSHLHCHNGFHYVTFSLSNVGQSLHQIVQLDGMGNERINIEQPGGESLQRRGPHKWSQP